jgi:hypothetical protein
MGTYEAGKEYRLGEDAPNPYLLTLILKVQV